MSPFPGGCPLAHTALARKYRPRRFADVSTQQHVSDTLRRAVAGNRVGHAYLFSGPRGVGKTTLARVLAMALNCPNREERGEPCGECENCTRIWGGHTSLDVVEIDAASNRGVEDARHLRERAMYAPSDDERFKVYIVDEAHMLTREAWNALLKILEEPPPRVIFVFATTEPKKIEQSAAPILSRCQRFDFRRIGTADIVARLESVLTQEGADGDPEALEIIARRAEGGMRDALSALDQVLSLAGGSVTIEAARRVLGLVEDERYHELMAIIAEGRHGDVFPFVGGLVESGHDLVEFYRGFQESLRTLLQLRLGGSDPQDLSAGDAMVRLAERFEAGDLLRMLQLAAELESSGSLRRTGNPRILIEMLLLRCSYLEKTVRLEDLLLDLGDAPAAVSPPRASSKRAGSAGKESAAPSAQAEAAARSAPAPSPPRPGSGPSAASGPGPVGRHTGGPLQPLSAWQAVLGSGEGLPRGIRPFLQAATASQRDQETLAISLPDGPALERMSEPGVLTTLEAALSKRAGRPLHLVIRPPETPAAEATRITPDAVKQARMEELLKREPALPGAVEELDLELLD